MLFAILTLFLLSPYIKADAPDHFILTQLVTLAMTRMDPVVNPGKVSGHLHSIYGASNFHVDLRSPADQQKASCSTAIIGADKSNYWAPTLMYRYPNNTFSPILGGARIYYFTKSPSVKPFPPGFRMVSGTAMTRDLKNPQTKGIQISCNHGLQTAWLPNATSHPGGCQTISLGIYFPSCGWANGSLDSPDHFSHMTWPIGIGGGQTWTEVNGIDCPASHPIKYPTLFYEMNYWLARSQPWRNEDNLLVLSNGDTTGNTYHSDFVNGWDQKVLQDTLTHCGLNNGPQDQLERCAPLATSISYDNMVNCRMEGKIVDEDVGLYRPIPKLPGCNPIWTRDMPIKPTCTPAVPIPGLTGANAAFNDLVFRTSIPIALPFTVKPETANRTFFPSLGASLLQGWGADGLNKDKLVVGSVTEILANVAGGGTVSSPLNPVAKPIAAINPPIVRPATSPSKVVAAVHAVIPTPAALVSRSSSPSASAASNSTTQGKMCKRKNRDLHKRLAREADSHHARRSRSASQH